MPIFCILLINITKISSVDEIESKDGSRNASDFDIVNDSSYLSDIDSQSDAINPTRQIKRSNILNNLNDKQKKLEPYLLQLSEGGEVVKNHFEENLKVHLIGQSTFPVPTKIQVKPKVDFFEENNQELLKEFIKEIHGSYVYKKEIINKFIADNADKKINKRKVEAKFDTIATKLTESQFNIEFHTKQEEVDKKNNDKRYFVS